MAERTVRAALIVIDSPGFDLRLRICDRRELVDVQTLVTEPPVERLDEGVFHGLSGANEVELHAALIRPVLECPRHEFRSVIDGDRSRSRAAGENPIEGGADRAARHARRGL